MKRLQQSISVLVAALTLPALGFAQTPPVADAGPSRYAADDSIRLDGTGSFDPDGGSITRWEWFQVSGPEVEISDADTATPVIDGFVQLDGLQTVVIGLVVGDEVQMSAEDSVEIIIVPRSADDSMALINPPFRPHLPTLIAFGGGDCVGGSALVLNEAWRERFNVITGRYSYPYAQYANQVAALLSTLAPEYDQPIQTIGFSTGGLPASVVASVLNQEIQDARYAVNRMTLLDVGCISNAEWERRIAGFNDNPVAGEPAWAEYYLTLAIPMPGALNVAFPGAGHLLPLQWFLASLDPDFWPDGDMYNGGVTGGFYVSVGGPARNLQVATDDIHYYFRCRELEPGCFEQLSSDRYPGRLPEPVRLIGPEDGAVAGAQGAVLSCDESQHATSYELLLGSDPAEMTTTVSVTDHPPFHAISEFPFSPTYWTVRVRDAYGSTIFADPRAIYPSDTAPVRRANRRTAPNP
jgi:hypothetical protein